MYCTAKYSVLFYGCKIWNLCPEDARRLEVLDHCRLLSVAGAGLSDWVSNVQIGNLVFGTISGNVLSQCTSLTDFALFWSRVPCGIYSPTMQCLIFLSSQRAKEATRRLTDKISNWNEKMCMELG